jgi:predicted signal transduction protein with EAL and GGDEF domain
MLARIGGDEFVVLLEDIAHTDEAVLVARRVVGAVSVPHHINGDAVPMSASVGIAVTEDPLTAAATLIAHADAAMYQAKRSGRGRITVFDPTEYARQRAGVAEEVRLAEELRRALTDGELEVHYQPIVDLQDSRLFATEALLRWRNPNRGLVTAGAFIDTAERAGLLPLIGAWVLDTACRQAVEWEQAFGERSPRYLFVNLAPVELAEPLLMERTQRTLATSGLAPERLVLEITESGLFRNATAAVHTTESLRSLGCGLAIDDFGTGYSSLSRLADVPAGTIKIDQTFSRHLPTNPSGTAVVSAVRALGHSLGRTVIAEGVETEDSLDELCRIGITHVQGFLLARPMVADELSALLDADGFAVP